MGIKLFERGEEDPESATSTPAAAEKKRQTVYVDEAPIIF
jgi:hypothetical protein